MTRSALSAGLVSSVKKYMLCQTWLVLAKISIWRGNMETTVNDQRELTANDRCDTCTAQALVVATFLNGELMFCGHHARGMKDLLKVKAANVYDPNGELF